MLIKLIKHDFISLMKKMTSVWIILGIVLGIQILISTNDISIDNSFGYPIPKYGVLAGIGLTVSTIISFSFFISGFIIAVQWFSRKMFKNEGYLTHTLPAKTSSIVISKVIVAVISNIIAGILGFLSMQAIAKGFRLAEPLELIKFAISFALDGEPETFLKISTFLIISGLSFMMFAFLAISITSIIPWGNKSFNSLILFLVFYISNTIIFSKYISASNEKTYEVSKIVNHLFIMGSGYNIILIILSLLLIITICSKRLRLAD